MLGSALWVGEIELILLGGGHLRMNAADGLEEVGVGGTRLVSLQAWSA